MTIKTVNTEVVTPEMYAAYDAADSVRNGYRALLEAAPAVECSDDINRLVRELDVLINGEAGAAKQASLCDIVAQVRKQGLKVPTVEGEPAAWLIENGSSDGDEDIVTLSHGVVRRFHKAGHKSAPLYRHPQPSLAQKVERIKAFRIAEPVDWVDRRHNSAIDKMVAILEDRT